ncbi:DUF2768 domain-containing protein [Savagea sp. SN6]|uniref:DUF2768 domain-containing protein n=1 Tax=Savagea serpentis TaxID=2785297 RepID=A0A8J7G8D9_9BACL|nr:DUF2768 domain-containing protein [Savagea serpentis]MBF4500069.1 DUF2768 domain-containing protein [Savagea serpentis]
MSPLDKMWLSFYGLGFMAISIGLILLSRHKIDNGILRFFTALIAWVLFITSFFIMVYLVFNGPTPSAGVIVGGLL